MTVSKRSLEEDEDNCPTTTSSSTSSFRNVSACNRCRLRKNRCDQRLPACASCEKARVKCVGYDPITKREIPRSYVYYLESRVKYLERLLKDTSIDFLTPDNFNPDLEASGAPDKQKRPSDNGPYDNSPSAAGADTSGKDEKYDREKLTKLVSNIGMVSVQGASDPRFLGSTSGISFARVVFAAVKSSMSGASSERGSARGSKATLQAAAVSGGTSMRDSFFGLHTKPTIKQAPFPDRELGLKLAELYFEHANPQIPILHRGEFMKMFERVYQDDERNRTARESYMLNIVYAIGSGIIMGSSESGDSPESEDNGPAAKPPSPPSNKRRRLTAVQHQPEEYHASAIIHLESFLGANSAAERPEGFGGGLEELQAVLLLAGFALLRPVAPGLWYIVGVAVRLGVDLGLHYEDGLGIDSPVVETDGRSRKPSSESSESANANSQRVDAKERGRRQWVRDLRRRLWWCVYSFDRLVSTCVGRPFGITDQVITTEFPSLLDDKYITREGFITPPNGSEKPSYKCVTYHYIRLRLLQSEILQVLQYKQAQQVRANGANQTNAFMHTGLPSPFLSGFADFRSWRVDIDRRLWEWKESAPSQIDAGVQFSPLFLELNYWQAVIMLYRQSLIIPSALAGELGDTNGDVTSPSTMVEDREDEDTVYLKVAEAGQKVLKIYRQLHRVHLVNYTFLATHHLFMAGISFLYAIWHSTAVRSHLVSMLHPGFVFLLTFDPQTLDDVDFTVLAATSVLGDLIDKCPPAEACRDAFDRMSKATIQMCMSTTGFGSASRVAQYQSTISPISSRADESSDTEMGSSGYQGGGYFQRHSRRSAPRFDMNLRDLFSDEETDVRSFGRISNQIGRPGHLQQQLLQQDHLHQRQSLQQQQEQQHQHQHQHQQLLQQDHHHRQHKQHIKPEPSVSPTTRTHDPPQPQVFNPNDPTINPPITLSPQSHHSHVQHQHQQHQVQVSPYQLTNTHPYSNFASSISNTYPDLGPFSDLDFLDSFPVQGASSGLTGIHGNGQGDVGGGASSGLDLGFGMGFDGNHDWSEGSGVDLFDGFFFGGSGGGL
ncbi:hypothetical protein EJ05DRAFT_501322 [Pseudovirgaria hyperparasitica]|uniref:Zn(2)-C6 fungal-type domain-containing protein n=1 Tax=Pseudovirgaria hyperparasitica TaxID=470096 RepID=A0A6A6W9M9_9PEZI|nr:uncharacterized protein EJ05DRAFT_501322 [Pseudovirgaria hyperparasitica]KAF2757801.1 hypothetical protein EJ05DRAFT_501322 [Pseudovirgaria hyperparasitica]